MSFLLLELLVHGLFNGIIVTLTLSLLIAVYTRFGLSKEWPHVHRLIRKNRAHRIITYSWFAHIVAFIIAWIINPHWAPIDSPYIWGDPTNAFVNLIGWTIPTLWFNLPIWIERCRYARSTHPRA